MLILEGVTLIMITNYLNHLLLLRALFIQSSYLAIVPQNIKGVIQNFIKYLFYNGITIIIFLAIKSLVFVRIIKF